MKTTIMQKIDHITTTETSQPTAFYIVEIISKKIEEITAVLQHLSCIDYS